jgi:hypothetical protein
MHCLTENARDAHLARKQGMRIAAASGGRAPSRAASAASFASVARRARRLFDYALKSQFDAARRMLASAMGSGRGS